MEVLQTPDVLGTSASEVGEIQQQWSTFGKVQAQLAAEGFQPLPQPEYACPRYLDPNVLSSHDSRVLTMEYAKYKAWRDFTAERLTYSKQILRETKTQMKKVEAACRRQLMKNKTGARSKKPDKEEVVELAQQNPEYLRLELLEQEHEQLKDAYEAKLSEFSSSYQLVSRVITMRGQDIQGGTRQGNIGNPAGGYGPAGGFGG
jgi:hypothetical protein